MTAALALNGRSLEERLSILAAALVGVAAGWTLWTGFLLLRRYGELAEPSTRSVMLAVVACVAAAQGATGFALLRRRCGGRWLAVGPSALAASVGLLSTDLISVLINTAAFVLVVRTWKFDPCEVAKRAGRAEAVPGDEAAAAAADSTAEPRRRAIRRPLRYTCLFGLIFSSVYVPGHLLTRSVEIAGIAMLSGIAAASAWYVARSKPPMPGGDGWVAFACATLLPATLAASSCTTMVWMWMTAISITGTPFDVPNINLVWVFVQAWITSGLAAWGVQCVLAWLSAGSPRHA
jgi:hypothetical protein